MQHLALHPDRGPAQTLTDLDHQVIHQLGEVFQVVTEWRYIDGNRIEAVIKVLTETAIFDGLFQVPVSGRKHTNINPAFTATAHPLHGALLQEAQQLRLETHGHIANFVQEKRAAVFVLAASPALAGKPGITLSVPGVAKKGDIIKVKVGVAGPSEGIWFHTSGLSLVRGYFDHCGWCNKPCLVNDTIQQCPTPPDGCCFNLYCLSCEWSEGHEFSDTWYGGPTMEYKVTGCDTATIQPEYYGGSHEGPFTGEKREIVVLDGIVASLAPETVVARTDETVFFDNTSCGGTTFHWSFGDGATATGERVSHSWDTPGVYTVTLTAESAYDSDQTTGTVTVVEDCATFKGTITDAVDGHPLPGATVAAVGDQHNMAGRSFTGGAYSFKVPANETYSVTAHREGYVPTPPGLVTPAPNEVVTMDFALDPVDPMADLGPQWNQADDPVNPATGNFTFTRTLFSFPGKAGLPLVFRVSYNSLDAGGALRVYHTDPQGSVVAVTDGGGAVAASFVYDPYGRVLASTGSSELRYLGGLGVLADANGLYETGARMYDPESRRFLTPDPLGLEASLNLYAYTEGDPVNMVDPTGADEITWTQQMIDAVETWLEHGYEMGLRDPGELADYEAHIINGVEVTEKMVLAHLSQHFTRDEAVRRVVDLVAKENLMAKGPVVPESAPVNVPSFPSSTFNVFPRSVPVNVPAYPSTRFITSVTNATSWLERLYEGIKRRGTETLETLTSAYYLAKCLMRMDAAKVLALDPETFFTAVPLASYSAGRIAMVIPNPINGTDEEGHWMTGDEIVSRYFLPGQLAAWRPGEDPDLWFRKFLRDAGLSYDDYLKIAASVGP